MQAQYEICAVYGASVISPDTCQRWLALFRTGDVNINDVPRTGCSTTIDDNQILVTIK